MTHRIATAAVLAALITLGGCSIIPAAFDRLQCLAMPTAPAKPALPSLQPTEDGGIQLNKQDAGALGEYILELERGYQ